MQLLHMDLTGTKLVKTQEGKVIALIVVDDYSRFTWVKLLKDRTEVLEAFVALKKKLENEMAPRKVAAIRTDGAREFVVDKRFQDYCEQEGITHQVSAPYAQWQNGMAERTIGELGKMAKAMMIQSGAPAADWGYAMEWATFLLNRIPSRTLNHKSRYKLHVVSNSIQLLTTSSIWQCGVGKSLRSEKRKNGPEREEVCVLGGLSSFQNFGRSRSEDKQGTDHKKLQGCARHLCLFEL